MYLRGGKYEWRLHAPFLRFMIALRREVSTELEFLSDVKALIQPGEQNIARALLPCSTSGRNPRSVEPGYAQRSVPKVISFAPGILPRARRLDIRS
jgi:hypothetical protein